MRHFISSFHHLSHLSSPLIVGTQEHSKHCADGRVRNGRQERRARGVCRADEAESCR